MNRNDAYAVDIPLPPLPEQEKIVAKIEELFTQLDAGIAELKNAQAQLKRYRQSVLKSAVEGELTKEWRESQSRGTGSPLPYEPASQLLEHVLGERREKWKVEGGKKKYKEPAAPDVEGLPDLPEGWAWAGFEQISTHIVDCLHTTPKFTESGKYCIDTTCIKPGKILFDRVRFVSEETYQDRVRRLIPEAGDILFAREGTIGTTLVVPENVELCLGQRMMMFRTIKAMMPYFFMYAMLSPTFENQWKPKVTGTTSPHVNIGDIRLMALPMPSIREQQRIVEMVERRLSVADEIEKDEALVRAERLRQSILKNAFEGQLA